MQKNKNVLATGLAGIILLASAGIALAAPAVATSNVNVRSGPGTGYQVVTSLRRGEVVEVTGCRGGWCYIEMRGPDGWVSANYLNGRNRATQPSVNFSFSFGNVPDAPRPPRPPRPGHHGPGNNGGWNGDGGWNGGNGGWDQGGRNDGPRWPRDR